ncbi:MAG: nicotinate phosphoribosyltransferase [Spirochaetota bacterium]|nr:nicotinate phosphoribosyltransferase [Spirochaetota bacterium]
MIIESLLDTDLYKFTMQQVVLHRFPGIDVEYAFKCRNNGIDFSPYLEEINREVDHLCSLTFMEEELEFLNGLRYIKKDFVDFLRIFRLNRDFVDINCINNELEIAIKGPWLHSILFEVPILAIINEIYYRNTNPVPGYEKARYYLKEKIQIVKENSHIVFFSDFGTRRRRSKSWHQEIIEGIITEIPNNFSGTSNVLLASKYGITPIGTMAHEFLQACQAIDVRLIDSQRFALENWAQEYRGDLGIALSDVLGMDVFLRDFDLYFCKLFDGVRHDSGDPYVWCDKLIAHYRKMRIDPKTKVAVFSDGLDFKKARDIALRYHDSINVAFGIGTNLTNDFGNEPLQIVIKMVRCNGQPVVKLSDSPGKSMCDDESYVEYIKKIFRIT